MSIHNKQSGGAGQRAIPSRLKGFAAGIAVASAVTLTLPSMPAHATNIATYTSPVHTFSVDDTIGGFNGLTFADDPRIICGLPTDLYPNSPACPEDGQGTVTDRRTGLTLYPVESEFGFEVIDFVGAEQKVQDFDYEEGFVADLFNDAGDHIGMLGRSARTARFKAAAPLGTSCAGLGAGDVKCSTEHYTVMEHVLTCFETIPYFFATPLTGPQGDLIDPITGALLGTCDDPPGDNVEGKLDDVVYEIVDGVLREDIRVLPDETGFPDLDANEGDLLNDIGQSTDYGLTKKDDGKPLYRWGNIVKRPTDLRFYIQLLVPEVWKTTEEPFEIAAAELFVAHKITNNPNDQIRPEDYENEGATGRIPGIIKDPAYVDNPDTNVVEEVWYSDQDCFEGDGDFIAAGTVFKNWPAAELLIGGDDPFNWSADLQEGLTNGWYTSIDRDPFQSNTQEVPVLDDEGNPVFDPVSGDMVTELVVLSGPRWRLTSNKYGQDIPGLPIPLIECSPTPFEKANIKYPVGEDTISVRNLLDWADDNFLTDAAGDPLLDPVTGLPVNGVCTGTTFDTCTAVSPLKTSDGWVDPSLNTNVAVDEAGNPICTSETECVSVNGLPITDEFDMAIYLKGEAGNATTVYDTFFRVAFEVDEPTDFGDAPPMACTEETPCVSFVNTVSDGTSVVTEIDPETGEPVESVQPSKYPVLLADDGARHAIVDKLDENGLPVFDDNFQLVGDGIGDTALGVDADPEFDGQPSGDALADDLNGIILDDEDGVEFEEALLPGTRPRVTVSFTQQAVNFSTQARLPAYLNAWIDFNRDGDWDDSYIFPTEVTNPDTGDKTVETVCVSEQVFQDVDVVAADAVDGDNQPGRTKLSLLVPPVEVPIIWELGCPPNLIQLATTQATSINVGSVIGPSFSRFRLSTRTGLGYSTDGTITDFNLLPDGDVEDHPVDIGGKFDDILGNVASVTSEDIGVDPGDLFVARSNGSSFSTSRWRAGAYAPILDELGTVLAEWVDIHVGDYNGDGFDDVVGARNDNGLYKVALSDVNDVNGDGQGTFSFVEETWGNRPDTDDYDWIFTAPGVFNMDARADLVQRRSDNGSLWVAVSTTKISSVTLEEENTFEVSNWGGPFNLDEVGSDPWVDFMTGDFNGDGRTDVIARDDTDQTWKVARAVTRIGEDGIVQDAFQSDTAGQWPGAAEWEAIVVGDFNSDGLDDLAGRDASTSLWRVSLTRLSPEGNVIIDSPENWCVDTSCVGAFVAFKVGDYNGDDNADIAMLSEPVGDAGNRRWEVLLSNGADAFVNDLAGLLSQGNWVDITVGDYNGDASDDIAARNGLGEWHVSISQVIDGDLQFDISVWDVWGDAPPTVEVDGWKDVQGGDFDGIFASLPLPTPEEPVAP